MIDEIHVRNLALIKEATLAPVRGMTVVTGETGAGKSALLSAIKLLVGGRADASMVREGADSCTVEGRFFAAGEAGEGTVVSRRLSADGRSRASVDGSLASVSELARGVGATVDLCGQHEHQRLLRQAEHVRILDAWGGAPVAKAHEAYVHALADAQAAADELARLEDVQRADTAQLDEARFTLARIEEISPQEGEYEQLMADLPRWENAEALAQATYGAHRALAEDGGAIDAVAQAAAALESLASVDAKLGEAAQSLREAGFVLEDVSRDMRDYSDEVERDPEALVRAQERAAALQGLMRTYGPRMEDVLARRDEARELIALSEDSSEALAAARAALDRAEADLAAAAEALSRARQDIAPRFAEAVGAQMARLEMGSASISVEFAPLERAQWTRAGSERIEFLFRAGSGMRPRPLARIASGGEVSRVMLAVKVVLGSLDEAETLVFDEVDAGVGGATARALADVLADLAKERQVIVVSHLAQVAVAAEAHYQVAKAEADAGVPETTLVELRGEDRVREVARMLSGDMGEASLEHAREMLGRTA